jgi:hypothetical protein
LADLNLNARNVAVFFTAERFDYVIHVGTCCKIMRIPFSPEHACLCGANDGWNLLGFVTSRAAVVAMGFFSQTKVSMIAVSTV